ncbi:MAG TPA: MBL fold metallo-hydrolase [Candidatus Eremiobacteraceae bacterium]|nr:MBL fold metallo-hydrolase [Candidatus Eremiobacteraceae bacterium]
MQLHVLGSAAGGGVPQWNCGCGNCTAAREHRLPQRTQASLAAAADGKAWVLFNVTTDIRSQLAADAALAPKSGRDTPRETPIEAIFLTDANVDHCAGLLDFRQAGELHVYSTKVVRDTLLRNEIFAPFARAPRTWHVVGEAPTDVAGLRISAIPVSGLLPSYAGGAAVRGAACAYLVEGEKGARALYAPIFADVDEALAGAAARCDAAFFDGSFWSDDELIRLGLGTRTAAMMGHQPVGGRSGSLAALRTCPCPRRFFTHLNNSNPMLDPASDEADQVTDAGFEVAMDGAVFELVGGVRARA